MKLIGKAENIDLLNRVFKEKNIIIPKYFYFNINQFRKKKNFILKKVSKFLKKSNIILRSSAKNEDNKNFSNAGKYDSIIITRASNLAAIKKILEKFILQFKSQKDKIIVQELIDKVDFAGVIFSKDINYNSPYYIINYDNSGKTDLITSGGKNEKIKSLIIYKGFKPKNKFFLSLIESVKKLEKITKYDRLDIEFAVKKKKLYLFQVRPLPKPKFKTAISSYKTGEFNSYLKNIKKKIYKLQLANPTIESKNTYFSNMSDWNPAEMIGDKPSPLAISLYRELITDEVWREQRMAYGYKNVFPNPLLFSFAGSPYIDLRTDIASFLPQSLNKKDTSYIINKYLNIIKKKPELHDKIEFELVETCFSFLSNDRLKKLFPGNIVKRYLKSLSILTTKIIKEDNMLTEINKVSILKKQLNLISQSNLSDIQKIFYIIKLTKNLGTLPFSGLARCAFISQRILLDLKELNLISNYEFNKFFNSINSITNEFSKDFLKLKKKKISKKTFMSKYGHLRPSTYDINSLNYSEGFKIYFSNKKNNNSLGVSKYIFKNFKKKDKINKLLIKYLKIDFNSFIKFATDSVYLREKSKLDFSRGINLIFENLISLGKRLKISRKDLSYIDLKTLLNAYSAVEIINLKKLLKNEISKNKFEFNIMKMIKMPDFIISDNDVYSFYNNISKANFITLNSIMGDVVELKKQDPKKLKGKILLIKNADPGFDYIFNFEIKGLITQYGGANSHMAIRCLELNIPAAIGVGKFQYDKIKNTKKILLNCSKKRIETI